MGREERLITDWCRRGHWGRDPLNAIASKETAATMQKPKWYSPQLSRELVSRLYHRAKSERVPMTVLANRIMEKALGNKERINTRTVAENQHITEPN